MRIMRSDTVKIGGKSVKIRKITVAQWRELFTVIETLPQVLLTIMTAAPAERLPYLVVAIEKSISDVVNVVSVLTELDADWIENNASVDELVTFFVETARVNNFGEMLKNVRGVLTQAGPKAEVPDQDAS